MAHFYADMKGVRGETSRTGTKNSGISAHIRGWDVGCRVSLWHDRDRNEDVITVYKTGGSNNPFSERYVVEIRGEFKGEEGFGL